MSAWEGDWKGRVRERIQAAGFKTALEYISADPGSSMIELAERVGNDVAWHQIELQAKEEIGDDRQALARMARGIYARLIREEQPNGWPDHDGLVMVVGVFPGSFPELRDACLRVSERLLEIAPDGWRASGPDDPILLEAFRDWPM